MKSFIKFLIILLCVFLLDSCKKDDCGCTQPPNTSDVYKMRADYSDFVCVGLTEDKKGIKFFPSGTSFGGDTTSKPLEVANGYYFGSWANYGVNSAYLNITRKDYQTRWPRLTKDSLMNMIMDADPYLEYYVDEKNVLYVSNPDSTTNYSIYDTAKLNQIIRNNELSTKLKRIK